MLGRRHLGGGTGVGVGEGQDETGPRRGRSRERKPSEFLNVPTCVDEAGRSWFDQSVDVDSLLDISFSLIEQGNRYGGDQGIGHGASVGNGIVHEGKGG